MPRLVAVPKVDPATYTAYRDNVYLQAHNDLLESIDRLKEIEANAEPELQIMAARTIATLYRQLQELYL